MVSIVGIVFNSVLLLVVIGLVIALILVQNNRKQCERQESPLCYTISCPVVSSEPGSEAGKCQGYAYRIDQNGDCYCNYAPTQKGLC